MWGYEKKPALWCKDCGANIKGAVLRYVKRKCQGHGKSAHYGYIGEVSSCCALCRKKKMVKFPRKLCSVRDCRQFAIFGLSALRVHCERHAREGEFSLIQSECASCGLTEILNSDNLCDNCEPVRWKRYVKRHETRVKYLLEQHQISFIQDCIPNGVECGRERPDFVIDCGTHKIIIEVDERQHEDRKCEYVRMFNITQTFGGESIFWIRYNPDSFKRDGKKIEVSQPKRESQLLKWIRLAQIRIPKNLAEVVHLFYDEWRNETGEGGIQTLPQV